MSSSSSWNGETYSTVVRTVHRCVFVGELHGHNLDGAGCLGCHVAATRSNWRRQAQRAHKVSIRRTSVPPRKRRRSPSRRRGASGPPSFMPPARSATGTWAGAYGFSVSVSPRGEHTVNSRGARRRAQTIRHTEKRKQNENIDRENRRQESHFFERDRQVQWRQEKEKANVADSNRRGGRSEKMRVENKEGKKEHRETESERERIGER